MSAATTAKRTTVVVDGNEAVASVAYRLNEIMGIYPITPSSAMAEVCDEWASHSRLNLWGDVPHLIEMQSEGGAIGAVHGALQTGCLATTFTASQGLLLMIPNMYKIAGELTPFCMHVAARSLATHALSIFGDHSDVMACRQTGFALLCSNNVQEAHDFACIGQATTLEGRIPVLHFFEGFRTSHEVAKIEVLDDEILRAMIDEHWIDAHRQRGLTPDHPRIRGTAQNPDVFFQAREACNPFYLAFPEIVQRAMDRFAMLTGRQYRLFDYFGSAEAERVLVLMGSGVDTVRETVEYLNAHGERVGVVSVRLFRPFSVADLIKVLPPTVQAIAVLDRTKEPGASGEPLYQDVITSLFETMQTDVGRFQTLPTIVGGRYGLSSKEFSPAMVKRVFDELDRPLPRNHFTLGIVDDVTHTSLDFDKTWDIEPDEVVRAIFYGLGADGTVGANKNSIKIIGDDPQRYVQGYFVYDSKKSGSTTISHLRFSQSPIRSRYQIPKAGLVACHQMSLLDRVDVLERLQAGGIFLLNAPYAADEVWDKLPAEIQSRLIELGARLYAIDAHRIAGECGLGRRINTIMQTCFFALAGALPRHEAIARIKQAVEKSYAKRGQKVVEQNYAAIDSALDHLVEVPLPTDADSLVHLQPIVPAEAPDFVKRVTSVMLQGRGDLLPVSAFPPDGTWPTGTSRWEKRRIATEIPQWEPELCIQCNKCAFVCPHAAIRPKVYDPSVLSAAPESFVSTDYRGKEFPGWDYTLQVAPDDCTGCRLCVEVCPVKDKQEPTRRAINMRPLSEVHDSEKQNFDFFLAIPEVPRGQVKRSDVKGSQFLLPLFEFSGACAGCGETPYLKLLTQLFGDRLLIANATGCSSIFGGNLPTTPWGFDEHGRGPAWSNSLFEDNAEFGLGFRLSVDALQERAQRLLKDLSTAIGGELVHELLTAAQSTEEEIERQRQRVEVLRRRLAEMGSPDSRRLSNLAEYLVRKSIWLVGGDGWAYDIGFGGLDHVLSLPYKVNILVLDTEVYSNTGGQASKSTPLAASAKFSSAGKAIHKKDLGMIAMSYGHVYVASVAFGAKDSHTVHAFLEADSFDGPSLIIAYSHCIAHGFDLCLGADHQKMAVNSGIWPLYHYDPRRVEAGLPPLTLDAPIGKVSPADFMRTEARFQTVEQADPDHFHELAQAAVDYSQRRVALYEQFARIVLPKPHQETRG
jgi:pyruvate-ferredoxin/flavodoxin oxidoreductase